MTRLFFTSDVCKSITLFIVIYIIVSILGSVFNITIVPSPKTLAHNVPNPRTISASLATGISNIFMSKTPANTTNTAAVMTPIELDAHLRNMRTRWKIENNFRVNSDGTTNYALDHFYQSLYETKKNSARHQTRIVHFGDSMIFGDNITYKIRRRFHTDFGDAGHGYVLLEKPTPNYYFIDVYHASGGEWDIDRITSRHLDNHHLSLSGFAYSPIMDHNTTWVEIGTKGKGKYNTTAGQFDIFYLAQPNGGTIEIMLNNDPTTIQHFSSQSPVTNLGVYTVTVPDGPNLLRITPENQHPVRLFDVLMKRHQSGVLYSTIAYLGASVFNFYLFDKQTWKQQLSALDPDLFIIQLGTNDSEYTNVTKQRYKNHLLGIITRIHRAAPNTAILFVSPLDRAHTVSNTITSIDTVAVIVEAQQEVARQTGTAFLNLYELFGGKGSARALHESSPRLITDDYTHPTTAGMRMIADYIYTGIIDGFNDYCIAHHLLKTPEDAP